MDKIYIKTEFIKLQQALKLANIVGQGSDAKIIIQEGYVYVNDEKCTLRGKKLRNGDKVSVKGEVFDKNKDMEFTIASYDN